MSRRRCRLIIILFVFTVFAQTASFSFLEYDDPINITKNRLVNQPSLQHLETLWKKPYLNLYIPVTYSLWMGISAVSNGIYGGLHPGLFHFINIVLHLVNALLVYAVLVLLLQDGLFIEDTNRRLSHASLLGALIFALHPVQVEPVVWATGLKDLLSAFFFLLTIRLILCGRQSVNKIFIVPFKILILATLTFFLAVLSKPSTVVLPVFVFILIRYVKGQKPAHALNFVLLLWLVLAAADALLTRTAQPGGPFVSILDRVFVASYSVVFYFKKLICPYPLSIDYGKTISMVLSDPLIWVYPIIPAGCTGLVFLGRRGKIFFFRMALVLICIAPILGLVPFTFQRISIVADRYLYLAVFAASIGIALMVKRYFHRSVNLALILLIIFYGAASFRYAAKWYDTQAIMRYTLIQNPESVVASHDLGVSLMKRGRPADAVVFLKKALNIDPGNARIRYDLAISYACMGDMSAAQYERNRVMQAEPELGHFLSDVLVIIEKSLKDGRLPGFIK